MVSKSWQGLCSELPIRYPIDKGSFRYHWSMTITRETKLQNYIPNLHCRTIAMTVLDRNEKGPTL